MVVSGGRVLDICGGLSSRLVMVAAAVGLLCGSRLRTCRRRYTHGLAHRCQRRPAREQHDQQSSGYSPHITHAFSISRRQHLG